MKLTASIFILIALIFAVSCDEDNPSAPKVYSMTGKWLGEKSYLEVFTVKLNLDLQEVIGQIANNPLTLPENCNLTISMPAGPKPDIPLVVTGTNKSSAISLTFQQPVGTLTYTGTLSSDGKTVTGKLHIAGFSDYLVPDMDLDLNLIKQ